MINISLELYCVPPLLIQTRILTLSCVNILYSQKQIYNYEAQEGTTIYIILFQSLELCIIRLQVVSIPLIIYTRDL